VTTASRNSSTLSAYTRFDLAWTFVHERPGRRFECKVGVLNLFNSPNYSDISFDFSENIGEQCPHRDPPERWHPPAAQHRTELEILR
jgi:hypothetical protein